VEILGVSIIVALVVVDDDVVVVVVVDVVNLVVDCVVVALFVVVVVVAVVLVLFVVVVWTVDVEALAGPVDVNKVLNFETILYYIYYKVGCISALQVSASLQTQTLQLKYPELFHFAKRC
jgi:hypothetical protein